MNDNTALFMLIMVVLSIPVVILIFGTFAGFLYLGGLFGLLINLNGKKYEEE